MFFINTCKKHIFGHWLRIANCRDLQGLYLTEIKSIAKPYFLLTNYRVFFRNNDFGWLLTLMQMFSRAHILTKRTLQYYIFLEVANKMVEFLKWRHERDLDKYKFQSSIYVLDPWTKVEMQSLSQRYKTVYKELGSNCSRHF